MSDRSETGSIRRLRGRRRIDATVALAAALPLVALGAVALTRPAATSAPPQPPTTAPLTTATLVCPAAAPGSDTVTAALGASGRASVSSASGGSASSTDLPAGVPQTLPASPDAQIVSVSGAAAPTLAASRWSSAPLAATACGPATTGQWFTGLGAGPYHDSVVELTNPLSGDAVVDLQVYGAKGLVQADQLQGVAVPAHGTVSFDLLHTIPRLDVLALHATVVRGQVAMSVRDKARALDQARTLSEWLPGQAWPSRTNTLLGLPAHSGDNRLVIANPGSSQLDATLKLVTTSSVFTPAGAPQIRLRPGSVAVVPLDTLLGSKVATGALGIELDATGPVTAELRRVTANDLSILSPGSPVLGAASLVVPPGHKRLVVGGVQRAGGLVVDSFDAHGHRLSSKRLTLTPQQGGALDLPAGATLVSLRSDDVAYLASVAVDTGAGTVVLPVRAPVTTVRVPAVRPAIR